MSAYFTLTLDTAPPASPRLEIEEGAAATGSRDVVVALSSPDFSGGAHDVTDMKIWGDVDGVADPNVQPAEGAALWMPYQALYAVRLSAGVATKTIFARLRDDVANPTLAFSDTIQYRTDLAVVTVVAPVTVGRISKVAGRDVATFGWRVDRPFDQYVVRAVPNSKSSRTQGSPIPTAHGSLNVAGTGALPANTTITTEIHGADLEAASPGSTLKVLKVFVHDAAGWSL